MAKICLPLSSLTGLRECEKIGPLRQNRCKIFFGCKQAQIEAVKKELEIIHLNVMIPFSLHMDILQTFKVMKKSLFGFPNHAS